MFTVAEMPKPIIIDGLSARHCTRKTAGTQGKCVICGRKTYRTIGSKPVCSYCTASDKAERLGPSWTSSIVQREPTG